jgi:thiamine biosynthesis lipoprotein
MLATIALLGSIAASPRSSFAAGAARDASPRVSVVRRVASMGTTAEIEIVARNREEGLAASELVVEELRRVEDLLTTWRDSPLRRLNEAPANRDVEVGTELAAALRDVLAWSERTDRAFDATVAPLVRAWDLRGAGRLPSPQEIADALAAVGPGSFRVDAAAGTAARLRPSAGLDEGAWGKGYALDTAARRLAAAGATDARIDLGGQELALGSSESGAPWEIDVAHPRDRGRAVLTLALSGLSVSTSGNSERGRTISGVRIGHELDPRTGRPAPDFGSVTVLAPSGLLADVLSTALFVLGPERGLELSEALRRQGISQEVLFLVFRADDMTGRLRAAASPSFSKHVARVDEAAVRGVSAGAASSVTRRQSR